VAGDLAGARLPERKTATLLRIGNSLLEPFAEEDEVDNDGSSGGLRWAGNGVLRRHHDGARCVLRLLVWREGQREQVELAWRRGSSRPDKAEERGEAHEEIKVERRGGPWRRCLGSGSHVPFMEEDDNEQAKRKGDGGGQLQWPDDWLER
jgi:hypothetical protein